MSTPEERRTIYATKKWHRLRSAKLDSQPLCEICLKHDMTVGAKVVHHIHSVRFGGDPFPDLDGLESLCWHCHNDRHKGEGRKKRDPKAPVDLLSDEGKKFLAQLEEE